VAGESSRRTSLDVSLACESSRRTRDFFCPASPAYAYGMPTVKNSTSKATQCHAHGCWEGREKSDIDENLQVDQRVTVYTDDATDVVGTEYAQDALNNQYMQDSFYNEYIEDSLYNEVQNAL